jgi:hypothetical protein
MKVMILYLFVAAILFMSANPDRRRPALLRIWRRNRPSR